MGNRHAVLGALAAVAIAMAMTAAPAVAQQEPEEDSDDVAAAMMCGSVYRVVAKQSKGSAAAQAYDASHAAITELATLIGTPVEDDEVRTRMQYSDEIVAEMLQAGEDLGEMVAECNLAFGLSIEAE